MYVKHVWCNDLQDTKKIMCHKKIGGCFMHAHTQTQRTADRGVMGGGGNLLWLFVYVLVFWCFRWHLCDVCKENQGSGASAAGGYRQRCHFSFVDCCFERANIKWQLTSLCQASIQSCHWSEVIHNPSVSLWSPSTLVTLQQDNYDHFWHPKLCHPLRRHKNIWWKMILLTLTVCLKRSATLGSSFPLKATLKTCLFNTYF